MKALQEKIKKLATLYKEEVTHIRRHLHQHPELSFQEHNTAIFIANKLMEWGIKNSTLSGTGIVGELVGTPGEAVIALRADIDALPIDEANVVSYKSQHKGVMHACGHDVHTACLLGAARILHDLKGEWSGIIKLIFQPGEEKNPGGASIMIADGVLQNPSPSVIIGQHVFPLLPVGKIGMRVGKYMAGSDEIYITVKGKGGHGSTPELCIDPVLILAHILISLQQIVSRRAGPKQPTVLTFGKIQAHGETNIIPNEAKAAGTFRSMDETWRKQGLQLIKQTAELVAQSMGGACEVEISQGAPCLENNSRVTQLIRHAAEAYMGKENVVSIDYTMGSEDFAFYSQKIPASFYRLGTANPAKDITSYLHTSTFNIDEEAISIGTGLMAWNALCLLQNPLN